MSKEKNKKLLEGYKQKGKHFTNPLESVLGGLVCRTSSLDFIYSEIFWIYFLYKKNGLKKTREILKELTNNSKFDGTISELYTFSKEELNKIKLSLSNQNLLILKDGLKEIIQFFKECPFRFIFEYQEFEEISKEEQEISKELIECFLELDYKYSFGYIMTLGIYTKNLIFKGKLKINENINFNIDLEELEKNKESKELLSEYGGRLRALSLMIVPKKNENQKKWNEYFWDEGLKKTDCYHLSKIYGGGIYSYYEYQPEKLPPQIKKIIDKFCLKIGTKIKFIIENGPFDEYKYSGENLEKDQILLGLFNRELNLCGKILTNNLFWEKEIVTILHRVVLENHINLIWFNEKATKEESIYFIEHGIGYKKLYVEKLKQYATKNPSNYLKKLTGEFEKEISKETNILLQDIDVGNPKKEKNLRDLAIVINRKELYDVYDSLSDTLHASWAFLSEKYLKPCTNPLHKRHKIPNSYFPHTNFVSPFIILLILIELLEYGKDKLKLNIEQKSIEELKKESQNFHKIFLSRWSQ